MEYNNKFIKTNDFETLIDFGHQPISNRFIDSFENSNTVKYPLSLNINKKNGLITLANPFPVNELKPLYNWLTCYEPENHLDELTTVIANLPGININSVIGAYCFKDATTLQRLEKLGYTNNWIIDPCNDFGIIDDCSNVETYQHFTNKTVAQRIILKKPKADVIIVRHVIEHAYNLDEFIEALKILVNENGYIVFEVPDCQKALESGDCTTIWEEHVSYFTIETFKSVLLNHDFSIKYLKVFPYTLENSIVAIVKVDKPNLIKEVNINSSILNNEIIRARNFSESIVLNKNLIRDKITKIRNKYGNIAIWGAGHLSISFISLMEIGDLISYAIDDNQNKVGKKLPLNDIKIISPVEFTSLNINICLLGLNPDNQHKVIYKCTNFIKSGGIFLSIFSNTSSYILNYDF